MDFNNMLNNMDPQLGSGVGGTLLEGVISGTGPPAVSSTSSSSSSSASSTTSASSLDLDIIAKRTPALSVNVDCSKLAVGPNEVDSHFPSRTPSPAITAAPTITTAVPAAQAALVFPPFEAHPKYDIVVPQQPSVNPSSNTVFTDRPALQNYTTQEIENGLANPALRGLFSEDLDEAEDIKEENDASNISVPTFGDSSGSFEPSSNNTSNTSVSVEEDQVDDDVTTKKVTRSRQKSIVSDISLGNIASTRASSRLRGTTSSQRASSKFVEGHLFSTLKEFLELTSPRLRENNHHIKIFVSEKFNNELEISLLSASLHCINEKAPISCGCTAIAIQVLDEEHEKRNVNKKNYLPKLIWQLTRYQPEHCMECMSSVSFLSEEKIVENLNDWLADKAYYENGNKISELSDNESADEEDEQEGRNTGSRSRGSSRRSASRNDRKKATSSERRRSSQHPIANEAHLDGSDMDISDKGDDSGTDSDTGDDVITVQASFPARLSQVKKEDTPQLYSRPSSSNSGSKVYRETKPLGPIPGQSASSQNKSKTSSRNIYGGGPSSSSKKFRDAPSSTQKKLVPPPGVLRNHAKVGYSKSTQSKSIKASSSSNIGLRKRSRSDTETSVTPEPEPHKQWRRLGSDARSPAPLHPPHLSQAPRKTASPPKRPSPNKTFLSPKTKISASTPISSFHLFPIAASVIDSADIETLGDFSNNGTTSRDLLVWFMTYYSYMKFGVDGCSSTSTSVEEGEVKANKLSGKEMMQLMSASKVLGAALAQLEADQD